MKRHLPPEVEAGLVSIEPLLAAGFDPGPNGLWRNLDWIIVGRLSGHGKRFDPTKSSLERVRDLAAYWNIPLFMKNNLSEIWGKSLIQEFLKLPPTPSPPTYSRRLILSWARMSAVPAPLNSPPSNTRSTGSSIPPSSGNGR